MKVGEHFDAGRSVWDAVLRARPAGGVHVLQLRPLPISATEIRGLVQSGRSARYLVPDPVLAHIEGHGLYRQESGDR